MKKTLIFEFLLLLFTLIFSTYFNKYQDAFYNYFEKDPSVSFCYVLNFADDKTDDKLPNSSQFMCKSLKNGSKTMVYFKNKDFKRVNAGVSYKHAIVDYDENKLEKIIQFFNLKIVDSSACEGQNILIAFSDRIQKFCYVKNRRVNMQIVVGDDRMIIGSPMVYMAF